MSIYCISKSICYNDEWCKMYYKVNFGWFGFDHVYDVYHWACIKNKNKNKKPSIPIRICIKKKLKKKTSVLAFAFACQVNYFGMWLCWLIIWFSQSSKPFLVVYTCFDFKELCSLKNKNKKSLRKKCTHF